MRHNRPDPEAVDRLVVGKQAFAMNQKTFAFFLGCIAVLVVMSAAVLPQFAGDWNEYTLTAVALRSHGTPEIRPEDARAAQRLMPEAAAEFARVGASIASRDSVPVAYFFRARNGDVFSPHFLAYSALAAVPMAVLEKLGRSPARAFLIVNSLFVVILGLALRRLFQSSGRAAVGVALFMLSGGLGYWQWISPECMSAAAFLAALALFTSGAPISGGILAGLAAVQNPPLGLFAAFAPLFAMAARGESGAGLFRQARQALQPRALVGIGLTIAIALAPILFNLWAWGVPSIIAATATDRQLVGWERLSSYYLDLNQGLLVAVPGICLGLLVLGVGKWSSTPHEGPRPWPLCAVALVCSLALAVPSLSTVNWNSGAAGVMRYAFWGSMPLLFALFCILARMRRWPLGLLLVVVAAQGLAAYSASTYDSVHFSPLAQAVLKRSPQFYNPDPEVFLERSQNQEGPLDAGRAYVYRDGDAPTKVLAHRGYPGVDSSVCGSDQRISSLGSRTVAGQGWIYLNGPFTCAKGGTPSTPLILTVAQFEGPLVNFKSGWSQIERSSPDWSGVWSDGPSSRLTIALPAPRVVHRLTIFGNAYPGNEETRVAINGVDFGRWTLAPAETIGLERLGTGPVSALDIQLVHQSPRDPRADPANKDDRHLAFFLKKLEID